MTGRSDFHKVNLQGDEAESVVTNSAHLAEVIERANCKTIEGLEEALRRSKDQGKKLGGRQERLRESHARGR